MGKTITNVLFLLPDIKSSPPESPMSTASDQSSSSDWEFYETSKGKNLNVLKRSNSDGNMNVVKQPRYSTKYDAMLQPLSPVTTLPVRTKPNFVINKTHRSHVEQRLQDQFNSLLELASDVNDVEEFLVKHSESLNVNEYNDEGRTALQQTCYEGNLKLAQLLVRYGADWSMTTREGFSALHIAAFAGHSHMLLYIMSLRHR